MAFAGRRWVVLLKSLVLFAVAARAQAPPGYTASYTTSIEGNPDACYRDTSVFCPCNVGFACIEIAPCRWKCLEAPTAVPSTLSTSLPSVSAYISTSIPLPISTPSAPIPSLSSIVQTSTSQQSAQSTQSPLPSPTTSAATYSSSVASPPATSLSASAGVIVITVTQRPSTCPITTTTVFTTSTSTGCPSKMICPSQAV